MQREENPSPTLYAWRTFAKSLIDAGVNIEQVATLLGHTSLETPRLYTTTEKDLAAAVEKPES